MSVRQLPARDYFAIKAAIRELIEACGGPVMAATFTRVGHQDLSRYGNAGEDHADRFMPADVIADLEAQCGLAVVTRELARLSGNMLVQLPDVMRSGSLLGAITAASLKETSDVFVEIGARLGDGKLCSDDADVIGREIDEAITKLAALKLQVHAEVTGGDQ